MFINEVPNNAELSAIIVNELRDLYGIKYRKEKKLKNHQVSREFTQRPNHFECLKLTKYIYSPQTSNSATERYLVCHCVIWSSPK